MKFKLSFLILISMFVFIKAYNPPEKPISDKPVISREGLGDLTNMPDDILIETAKKLILPNAKTDLTAASESLKSVNNFLDSNKYLNKVIKPRFYNLKEINEMQSRLQCKKELSNRNITATIITRSASNDNLFTVYGFKNAGVGKFVNIAGTCLKDPKTGQAKITNYKELPSSPSSIEAEFVEAMRDESQEAILDESIMQRRSRRQQKGRQQKD